jgi:hypothetical protein
MENDQGKQIVLAMKAVANMHSDCIKLFEDLDKAIPAFGKLVWPISAVCFGPPLGR